MKLYYTVSSGYLQPQTNYINSLGGFPSSTPVPNDIDGNLFDELSLSEIKDAKTQYRAIILQNNSDKIAENVELWFESPDTNVCIFMIGATLLTQSGDEQYMESVDDSYSKPFETELYEATIDQKVTIGNMDPNQMIGLWISRSVDKEKAFLEYNNVAERDFSTQSRYKPVVHDQEEKLNFKISWD